MTRNNHVCGLPDSMCDTECMENAYRSTPELELLGAESGRFRQLLIQVDGNSFDALKECLYKKVYLNIPTSESPRHRMNREALKRVFDQIRNVEYNDK